MSRPAMIEVLQSSEPCSELAEKLRLFGQFVGSWDVEVVNWRSIESTAEWSTERKVQEMFCRRQK